MEGFELIGQGAEARLYKGTYLGRVALVKERFAKKYRHPRLDARLTKDRTRAEARAIVRAKAAGVATPALFLVDLERGSIVMEYIENAQTLKSFIEERAADPPNEDGAIAAGTSDEEARRWIDRLAVDVARTISKLHSKNIIHGDLTTSNVLIRRDVADKEAEAAQRTEPPLFLVDFGLARVDSTVEDKAVDLYVLERSLLSTRLASGRFFTGVLSEYISRIWDDKQRRETISKYEEVKARGRKRCALG